MSVNATLGPRCRKGPGEAAVGLTMAERRAVTKEMARRYHKAPKKLKGVMLTELCGKRLRPFMAEIVGVMERLGELELTPPQRDQLLQMSAATIDRRLSPDRLSVGSTPN